LEEGFFLARFALSNPNDPIFQELAISHIFGIFASTALTLIVIPLLYLHGDETRSKWRVCSQRRTGPTSHEQRPLRLR
jgi:predicted RND superfamily exporter protein